MHCNVYWAAVCIALSTGCELGGTTAQASAEPTARKADPTPEVIARAESILREHPDAAIGTEFPFQLNGKRYVARVEEHDNPEGKPGRPSGKHKGVTVYVAN